MGTPPESVMSLWTTPHSVMYIDFHKTSFLQTVRGALILILSAMMQTLCSIDILTSTPLEILFLMKMRKKKLSVLNQWRVLNNDITDSGGVANLKMSIIRIY